jgi:hypothetical protein
VLDAQLAVDMNRDGSISFGGEDATSSTNLYHFWINNNHDGDTDDGSWYTVGAHHYQYDITGSPDLANSTITFTRDLEDFALLGIQIPGAIQQQLTNGDIVVKLESAGSSIKVFPAVAGNSLEYLTVGQTATNQLTPPYNITLGPVGTTQLPRWLWTNSTTAYLLFEGISSGQREVKVGLYQKNGALIGYGKSIWLNLKDVKNMYETWSVGTTDSGPPNNMATNCYGFQYTSSSPETSQYVLFVHGWNMPEEDKDYFANTAYKRLWWQGYKGRFGSFRWPTDVGKTTFDHSEWMAWLSATGLSHKLTALNILYPGQVYLFGHSMGNVVAGEALKINNGTGNGVNTYVACQAAIAAHAYDPVARIWTPINPIGAFDGYNTPDDLANYPPTGAKYFNGVATATYQANFRNENDWALSYWVLNQRLKPDGLFVYVNSTNYSAGATHLYYPADTYEIFAKCVQNRSYALGATSFVLGFDDVDLQSIWGGPTADIYGHNFEDHPWHSGEFYFSTVEQWNWWGNLAGAFFNH